MRTSRWPSAFTSQPRSGNGRASSRLSMRTCTCTEPTLASPNSLPPAQTSRQLAAGRPSASTTPMMIALRSASAGSHSFSAA